MFPLGSVVFPYTAIPLRVFEPRYLTLLDRVLVGDRRFGTVLIERGFEVGGGDDRFEVGTLVEVVGQSGTESGERAIVVAGIERIGITDWLPDDPYPIAAIEPLPDTEVDLAAIDMGPAIHELERVMALASELGADTKAIDLAISPDPLVGSYQLSALAPLAAIDSYALLRARDPASRLELARRLLSEQAEVLLAQLAGG
jgi:Lon protease-like protein